jgi:hypothetical protein
MRSSKIFFLVPTLIIGMGLQAQTAILSTDFESGIPVDYALVDNDGFTPASQVSEYTAAWITVTDPDNSANNIAASTSFFDPTGTANRWMITPALTLGAYGNYISWNARSHDASFPDDYLVLVSTTDDALESFTDTIGYVQEENNDWTTREVNLSEQGYDDQTIYVAFINTTNDGFKLYMDSLEVWKEDPVGVNELNVNKSVVYPNPFKEKVSVRSELLIASIWLTDLSGKRLLEKDNSIEITTETLPSGVYLISIQTIDGKIETQRIIKY